jgi:arabinofuranosyltransferase
LSIAGCDAAETDEQFMTRPAIGMYGYQAGLGKIIIDPLALTDPLLARLPADPGAPQRIGHFKRALPEGYLEHLADPEAPLADAALDTFLEKLERITQGERLFTAERLRAIWDLNRGRYDPLLEPYRASQSSGPARP